MHKNGWLGRTVGILGIVCLAGTNVQAQDKDAVCAAPARAQILPLGDSITYGFAGSNGDYRGPLYDLLRHEGHAFVFVGGSVSYDHISTLPPEQWHHEGHGSYDIATLNNNLDGLDATFFCLYRETNRNPNGGHWLDGVGSGA